MHSSVRAGYNAIIWSDVVRQPRPCRPAWKLIRGTVPVQGGGSEPEFPGFEDSTLIAHGLDASVMFQW